MGEGGGINLYAILSNNAVSTADYLGMRGIKRYDLAFEYSFMTKTIFHGWKAAAKFVFKQGFVCKCTASGYGPHRGYAKDGKIRSHRIVKFDPDINIIWEKFDLVRRYNPSIKNGRSFKTLVSYYAYINKGSNAHIAGNLTGRAVAFVAIKEIGINSTLPSMAITTALSTSGSMAGKLIDKKYEGWIGIHQMVSCGDKDKVVIEKEPLRQNRIVKAFDYANSKWYDHNKKDMFANYVDKPESLLNKLWDAFMQKGKHN